MSAFEEYDDEEWASIPGYPNYEISTFGRVWSFNRNCFLKLNDSSGYDNVQLCYNGNCVNIKIHRLVAMTFKPIRPEANEVNHDDGDKRYNYFENLEWSTPSENQRHAYRTGLHVPWNPTNKRAIRIIEIDEIFESLTACADAINGSISKIQECASGRRKKHRGFSFEYVDSVNERRNNG
jgi:NUMOD4 motif/HNH endonuclease